MRVAVIGAGHGGLATAGHLAIKGHAVRLFSFYQRELKPVLERGGILLEGEVEGLGRLERVSGCLDEVLSGAEIVFVILPALAHKTVASLLVGCIENEQILLLSPGRTGGALEMYQTFRRYQLRNRVIIAECQTFLYATESRGPAHVEIMKVKNRVRASTLPSKDNVVFFETLAGLYPEYVAATSVLETSINNTGAVVHPAPMLMNSGLLERAAAGEDLRYYRDVISRFVCDNVMERIDTEKSAVARAFEVPVYDIRAWYEECYGVIGGSLYEVLQNNPYYDGFSAPKHVLAYHHVLDEIPNSLVPLSSLGCAVGVKTPTIDAIVNLACTCLAHDYWREGRTVEGLGLGGQTPEQMLEFVLEGPRFWEV